MNKSAKLETLRKKMAAEDLPLKKGAKSLVFGNGDPEANLFFIGEAPGRHEDEQGLPFVGSAGRHLDTLLSSIDLSRQDIYITSILKYRPPNNRPPKLAEIKAHTPFLVKQIQTIDPDFIVPLGNFAAKFVLSGFEVEQMGKVPGITALHGKPQTIKFLKHTFTIFPLYHPAAVFYNFGLKKALAKDFQKLSKMLQSRRAERKLAQAHQSF